ncbi:hypothetical protein Tco_0963580 [Tanacetum coccineum]
MLLLDKLSHEGQCVYEDAFLGRLSLDESPLRRYGYSAILLPYFAMPMLNLLIIFSSNATCKQDMWKLVLDGVISSFSSFFWILHDWYHFWHLSKEKKHRQSKKLSEAFQVSAGFGVLLRQGFFRLPLRQFEWYYFHHLSDLFWVSSKSSQGKTGAPTG